MNDIEELQNYLFNKYNIKVYVNKSKKINIIKNIKDVYVRLLLIIIIIFIFSYLYIKYLIYIKYFNILLIILILIFVFLIQKYVFMIYFYYKNKTFEYDSVNYDNIKFETGDIMQEVCNWNYNYGILLYLFPLDYLHNSFIIKFNNKNYILHYTNGNNGYPQNILSIKKTNYIELYLLDDYIKDNYHATKYYRLFKSNKKIDNESVFKFLQILDMENLKFSFFPCIKETESSNNRYNCMSFILKILIELSIIKKFNIHNFSPNDLKHLPHMSNNIYNQPIFVNIK